MKIDIPCPKVEVTFYLTSRNEFKPFPTKTEDSQLVELLGKPIRSLVLAGKGLKCGTLGISVQNFFFTNECYGKNVTYIFISSFSHIICYYLGIKITFLVVEQNIPHLKKTVSGLSIRHRLTETFS